MSLGSRFSSLVFARLDQALRSLQAALGALLPQPRPVLVPIPIRVDRRWRGGADR